jgi:hypothetical protein
MFRILNKQNNGYEFNTMQEAITTIQYDLKYIKVHVLNTFPNVIWYRKLPNDTWSSKKEQLLDEHSSIYTKEKNTKIFWIAREYENSLTNETILKQHTHTCMNYEEFLDEIFKVTLLDVLDDDTFYRKYSI